MRLSLSLLEETDLRATLTSLSISFFAFLLEGREREKNSPSSDRVRVPRSCFPFNFTGWCFLDSVLIFAVGRLALVGGLIDGWFGNLGNGLWFVQLCGCWISLLGHHRPATYGIRRIMSE